MEKTHFGRSLQLHLNSRRNSLWNIWFPNIHCLRLGWKLYNSFCYKGHSKAQICGSETDWSHLDKTRKVHFIDEHPSTKAAIKSTMDYGNMMARFLSAISLKYQKTYFSWRKNSWILKNQELEEAQYTISWKFFCIVASSNARY